MSYKIITIEPHPLFTGKYRISVDNDAAPGVYATVVDGEWETSILSGWPKDIKDFNMEKDTFRKIKDLKAGDIVTTL